MNPEITLAAQYSQRYIQQQQQQHNNNHNNNKNKTKSEWKTQADNAKRFGVFRDTRRRLVFRPWAVDVCRLNLSEGRSETSAWVG